MRRAGKFLISRPLYAVRKDSFAAEFRPPNPGFGGIGVWRWTLDAVWFRRRRGVTVACTGQLWAYRETEPADAAVALADATDGRHGGDCMARWDGRSLWILPPQSPSDSGRYMGLLRPMLDAYPDVPEGYDGWWEYER